MAVVLKDKKTASALHSLQQLDALVARLKCGGDTDRKKRVCKPKKPKPKVKV